MEAKDLKTYAQVADYANLMGITKALYIAYMTTRWANTEEQKSKDGYAFEWAERFRRGVEYEVSDSVGQAVLKGLSSVYKGKVGA